jgi:4-amino-4-deoxy-L-arabinose transferase-like glycosyltransferase
MTRKAHRQSPGRPQPPAPPAPPRSSARLGLLFLLVLFLALAGMLAGAEHPGRFPDEAAHLDYVRQLASGGGFVDFRTQPLGTEMHQPPAYYLIAALVWRLSGSLVAVRLLSVLAGLLTIVLTWLLAREWLPEADPWLWAAAAGAVGFLPMNFYLCGAASNDAATCLAVTGGVLLLLRALKHGFSPGRMLGLGLVCGLALMVKSTSVCLLAAVLVALALERRGARTTVRLGGVFLLGCALVAGPWMVRNTLLYGDPLAAGAFRAVAIVGSAPRAGAPGFLLHYWGHLVLDVAWLSFWGAFDHLQGLACAYPSFFYLVQFIWPIGAIAGALRPRVGSSPPWRRRFGWALTAGFAVLLVGFVDFNRGIFQAQSRYFFAFLPPLMILMVWGLSRLWPGPRAWRLPVVFAACLLIATVWGLTGPMWAGPS